jgi:hypothetical protein
MFGEEEEEEDQELHKKNKVVVVAETDPTVILRDACLETGLEAEEGIKRAIDVGADVNTFFPTIAGDLTPLMQICSTNDRELWEDEFDLVKLVLAAGADPNLEGDRGTSLHIAARYSSPAIVKLLIEKGALANIKRRCGSIPLVDACARRSDLEAPSVVRVLVAATRKLNDGAGFSKAVFTACRHSKLDIVTTLQQGAMRLFSKVVTKCIFETKECGKTTCLMAACGNRFDGARIVRFLLSLPGGGGGGLCDSIASSKIGYSALQCACMYGNGDIVRALLSALPAVEGVSRRLLSLDFVELNDCDALGVLKAIHAYQKKTSRRTGLEIDAASDDALWAFAHFGGQTNEDMSKHLRHVVQFAEHARFGKLDDARGSYLHVAAKSGDLRVVQALMKQNFSPFYADRQKRWPIDVAASKEIKDALTEYMKWKPKRQVQAWFGPSFVKRVWTMLLILTRLRSAFGLYVPADIRKLLAEYAAKTEPVCMPWRSKAQRK